MTGILVTAIGLGGLGCLFFILTAIRFLKQLKQQEIEMAAFRMRRHQQREQQQDLELGIKDKRIHRVMDSFQFHASLQHDQQHDQQHEHDQQQQQKETISTKSQSSSPQQEHSVECCICLEPYNNGQVICSAKTTECNHIFHQNCAMQWFQNHDQCPLCRVTLIIDIIDDENTKI
jgi:hypothetical protein